MALKGETPFMIEPQQDVLAAKTRVQFLQEEAIWLPVSRLALIGDDFTVVR